MSETLNKEIAETSKPTLNLLVDERFIEDIELGIITKSIRHPKIPLDNTNKGQVFNLITQNIETTVSAVLVRVQNIEVTTTIKIDQENLIPGQPLKGCFDDEFEDHLFGQLGFESWSDLHEHCLMIDKNQSSDFTGKIITWELSS